MALLRPARAWPNYLVAPGIFILVVPLTISTLIEDALHVQPQLVYLRTVCIRRLKGDLWGRP